MKKKTREGVPAGADGIRFQRPDFQVSFRDVDDYWVECLLLLSNYKAEELL